MTNYLYDSISKATVVKWYNRNTEKYGKLIAIEKLLHVKHLTNYHNMTRFYLSIAATVQTETPQKPVKKIPVVRTCPECGTVLTTKEWPKGELCPVCYPSGHLDI